jgi:hypothetical protein
LGHAWATQGPPKPRPNPNESAEGRKRKKPRGAIIAALQTVIVPCRWPKARALSAAEGERRMPESNDLKIRLHCAEY